MKLAFWRRNDPLPYNMFDLAKEAYDAKKAEVLANIYYRGQERAWSGKEVLPMLIEKLGPPALAERERESLARIFAIILWGELAAWKISAQLADAIEPLEAKMAATSQAFDEARHFYTMYDYLKILGYVPENIDRRSEKVLDLTLRARTLPHKVCGMQLMIETIALTIFQTVREKGFEPVLGEVLRYFEIDEARHIGLGINYMPTMIKSMNKAQLVEFMLFQLQLMFYVIASLKALEPDLRVLGIKPAEVVKLGKAKQFQVFKEMWAELGVDITKNRPMLGRILDASDEWLFPDDPDASRLERGRRALKTFFSKEVEIDKDFVSQFQSQLKDDTVLEGMGAAGAKWRKNKQRDKERASA